MADVILPELVERAFLATIARTTTLRMYGSPRIWYEPEPFCEAEGIAAYRRYEVNALHIDEVGIALAVDVRTAFFTTDTLADFFDPQVSEQEGRAREQRLYQLLGRQQGQKGTLLYDTGDTLSKCYFVQAPAGVTCSTTGRIRLNSTTYPSLAAYYQAKHPSFGATDDLVAVQVSFPTLDRAQWVVANRVRARVMNDQLPRRLAYVDKLDPEERRSLLVNFWDQLGPRPLSRIGQEVAPTFWRPASKNIHQYPPVSLTYGQGTVLPAPRSGSRDAYQAHYRQRLDTLHQAGAYALPAGTDLQLYGAYPARLRQDAVETLVDDMMDQLARWTGKEFTAAPIAYTSVMQDIEQIRKRERGLVVFVLDHEPVAYYDIEFHLDGWRLKRLTEETLCEKDRERLRGAWDRKQQQYSGEKGRQRWQQFVTMCTLDVLQQLDGVPWRIDHLGPYEALLTIDVGPERRFFAVSLLVARDPAASPSFRLVTHVHAKMDHQHETINPRILQDAVVQLVQEALGAQSDPLRSLLVLRDGRTLGQEYEAITAATEQLRTLGLVTAEAPGDVIDLHKESQIPLRLWEVNAAGHVNNPLEGTVVSRLPLPIRRADEELRAREAQEIRRLR